MKQKLTLGKNNQIGNGEAKLTWKGIIAKHMVGKHNMEANAIQNVSAGSKTNSVRSDVCSTNSHSAKCYVWLEGLVIEHRS